MIFGSVKKNILVLSTSNLIIGLIEFIFNIYLSRIFGPAGLGLLSLITPINCIFLSFMTEGVVITMSKTASKLSATAEGAASHMTVVIATIASFLWSVILVFIIILTAPLIARYFLGDASLMYPILATCPLMILMSISNILKGYFLGLAKIKIPAVINICEKLLRFPILFALIGILLNKWDVPAVTLVFLCYAIGEMQSVLLLLIYYRKEHHERVSVIELKKNFGSVLKPLARGSVPICLTQCLFELVNALSSVIVKERLVIAGFSAVEALELLGKYRGMVFPLMTYPMILVGAACAILIPKISTMYITGKKDFAGRLLRKSLKFSVAIGLVTAAISLIFSGWMGEFFYGRSDLGFMISVGGLCAPIIYTSATTSNLLISLGKEKLSFRNSCIQQGLLLVLLWGFTGIRLLNIYGYFLAIAISNSLLILINFYALQKKTTET